MNICFRRAIASHVAAATLILTGAAVMPPAKVLAQAADQPASSIELIDPRIFRVCADPRNMPFSTDKEEGFENKLAGLFATKLGKSVANVWYPGAMGFVRNTLNAHRCDVIMGFPQGSDLAQTTNPYYRTAYTLVFKPGVGLDAVDTLSDPVLKTKRIGIVAGTPPATYMAINGLLSRAKSYPLAIDTRADSSVEAMIKDIESGEIDLGIMWGPIAGFYASKASPKLSVVPLLKETGGPRLTFRISMAVRPADQEFKRLLNRMIQENQSEIDALLLSFGAPILNEKDQLIVAASLKKK
jgi:quinoprotein dehydrogenase-associated probable ABC transporter substrate-binding protein